MEKIVKCILGICKVPYGPVLGGEMTNRVYVKLY